MKSALITGCLLLALPAFAKDKPEDFNQTAHLVSVQTVHSTSTTYNVSTQQSSPDSNIHWEADLRSHRRLQGSRGWKRLPCETRRKPSRHFDSRWEGLQVPYFWCGRTVVGKQSGYTY
jgi:hypothetical protein